jgi:putative ABC transport system substrate-binding protein
MMDRRAFIAILGGSIVSVPLVGEAQQAGRVYRVGILGEKSSDPSEARLWQIFRSSLRERCWMEGTNVVIESRWAEGNSGRIRELADELVRLKVDLIVTRGSIYTQGARAATSSIPIVSRSTQTPRRRATWRVSPGPAGTLRGCRL